MLSTVMQIFVEPVWSLDDICIYLQIFVEPVWQSFGRQIWSQSYYFWIYNLNAGWSGFMQKDFLF
jgi:hypothetical protein